MERWFEPLVRIFLFLVGNTQGVTLIRLAEGEQLVRVDAVSEPPVDPVSKTEIEIEHVDDALIDNTSVEAGDESVD